MKNENGVTIQRDKFLTKDELKTFLKTVRQHYKSGFKYKEKNLRDYLVFRLAYLHGMRISEVLTLKWCDVNFDDNLIFINRLKNSMSANQIMKPDEAKDLKRLRNLGWSSIFVFVNPNGTTLTRQNYNIVCNKIAKECGLTISPHSFKHTCAVHLALAGKNIREIQHHLGHKDLENTLIYLNYSPTGDANDLI